MKFDNFFTSGLIFDDLHIELKSRYQMVNIGLILSSIALVYGIIVNIIRDVSGLISIELFLLSVNIILFFILRKYEKSFECVALILTAQFTFFFIYLLYISEPSDLKHIWLFTYPIILLYFQKNKSAVLWFIFIIAMIITIPLQSFIEVNYSLFQVTYISFVLIIVSVIVYFYQIKMNEAKKLILEQQDLLKKFNIELAQQLKELKQKDKLLTAQSKQAVMGEMISMIAHQWRQPLSTITLQISNYQIKQMLNQDSKEREIDKTLSDISDTIIYLSETVDDFQTYFHQEKELTKIEVHDLIQKALNFALPRINETNIKIELKQDKENYLNIYVNEIIQVILNILNNAIDALIESKKNNPIISIEFITTSNKSVVKIKDNANGIEEQNIEHLFEPYFSTKGKNGTGLGLYMSQMIMQKQFGTMIEVESSKEGSTFIVTIPKQII